MAHLSFEEMLDFFAIRGEAKIVEHRSTRGFPEGPNPRAIQCDQQVDIEFNWRIYGQLARFLAGQWVCEILFEQQGGGEFDLPNNRQTGPYPTNNPYVPYEEKIQIPGNTVPPGLYRVTCIISFNSLSGHPGPITAFADLGLIRFYNA